MRRYDDEVYDDAEPMPRYPRCTCNSQSLQPCGYCEQDAPEADDE